MNRKRRSRTGRFVSSAVIALPVTVALLFLMTRLILPGEQDRIVTRMIQNIELRRAVRPPDSAGFPVLELPLDSEEQPLPAQPNIATEGSRQTQIKDTLVDEGSENERRAYGIDWLAEAHRLTQEPDEEALKRWLVEQGYERYVSNMQGSLPITNSVQVKLPPTQEDATGYMNSYGDMEYKISQNCVATTQVAARLDYSDFAKALPMVITCTPPPKQKLSFDRFDSKRP